MSSIPADEVVSGTDVAGYTTPPEVGTSSADAVVASKPVSGEMARGITRASTKPLYSSHLEPADCESGAPAITGLPMNTAAVLREVACGEGVDLSPHRSLVFRATAPSCSPEEDFDDWG